MPPVVNLNKCDGCRAEDEPLCEQICPGNLMTLNDENKAIVRERRDCWDCMCCTKICPQGAIETKLPYQLGYYPAKLIPKVGTNQITWTSVDINGKVERFVVKTRNDDNDDFDDEEDDDE